MKYTSIFALTLLAAVPALAFPSTTWVSHLGSDVLGCYSIANPCRTFQWAFNQTNSGGIIKAMDAGDFGPILIDRPITIDGNGVGASIEVFSTPGYGVLVNTASNVEIRNLAIQVNPFCPNCYGISTNGYVSIENVSITGSPFYGVYVHGFIAAIHGVTVTGAGVGIYVGDATATISDSLIRYSSVGIQLTGTSAVTQALIERSKIISNTTGLEVVNSGLATTARISDCVITGNTNGVATSNGGQIITFRNNTWAGNTTDGTTPFSLSLK
jgi:hypothetical protein